MAGKSGAGSGGATGGAKQAATADGLKSPKSVLAAQSIAIVGASEKGRWPTQIFNNLKKLGYKGQVYLINPRQTEIYGERCYPSLKDLPAPAEHAAVLVPTPAVQSVLEDAAASGVRSATIYAAGFGEGSDPDSAERGEWLRNFIARSQVRISGPNCMGSFSYRERLFAYPHAALCELEPGPVGLVFQSGGNLQFYMQSGGDRGLRYSYAVSTGNEPDLNLADYVNFLVDDPNTSTIVLFIEGIRKPGPFMVAAGRALAAGKPIICIKTGRSQASREAAMSHTGAIAGDFESFLAMCDRFGIVCCRSMDDLVETALAFQCGRRPKGPKIGFVTTSGGTVDLLYDYCEAEGAALATFSEATKAALLPTMQEGIAPKNPLDVGIPSTSEAAAGWCRTVHNDADVDMVGFATNVPKKGEGYGDLGPFAKLTQETSKPLLGFARVIHQSPIDIGQAQRDFGFPLLQGLEPTVRAMNALWFHAQRQGKAPVLPPPAQASTLTAETLEATLATYGIVLPKSTLATKSGRCGQGSRGHGLSCRAQDSIRRHSAQDGGGRGACRPRDRRKRWRKGRASSKRPRARHFPRPASMVFSSRRWCRVSRRS